MHGGWGWKDFQRNNTGIDQALNSLSPRQDKVLRLSGMTKRNAAAGLGGGATEPVDCVGRPAHVLVVQIVVWILASLSLRQQMAGDLAQMLG